MKPPRRLLDDPELAAELRLDLERAATAPEPYDVARGEAKLAAALALGSSDSAGETADAADAGDAVAHAGAEQLAPQVSSSVLSGTALKVGLSFAAAGVIGTALLLFAPARETRAPAPKQNPRVAVAAPAPEPAPAQPAAPLPEAAAPAIDPAKAAPDARRSPDADAELRRETAQLGRIKQLLETHPARAYALAQSGHREFSRGMLREEREALAVLALWNMGDDQRARLRAEAFLERYPNGSARGQLEQRLARARQHDAKAP